MKVTEGGHPGLPVHTKPDGLCGRKVTLNCDPSELLELCESRGGRPGFPVPNDKPYGLCRRKTVLNQIGWEGLSEGVGESGKD